MEHQQIQDHETSGVVPNRRKRFFPTVSLGNILTGLAIVGSCIGVYTTVVADVRENKTDIANLKEISKEQQTREAQSRREIKDDIRDVKKDVGEVRETMQKILFELQRRQTRGSP